MRSVGQGYVKAAQMFEQESGTPPGIDLGSITDRMEIRRAVQSGNVEEAIEKVNDLNPEVGALCYLGIGLSTRHSQILTRQFYWHASPGL